MPEHPASTPPLCVLHVEDNPGDVELVRALLEEEWPGCNVRHAQSAADVRRALETERFDVVLSDFSMPHFNGTHALELVHEHARHTPFIFVSGTIGEEHAVQALKHGATDYILKDRLTRLVPAIRRALQEAQLREQLLRAQRLESIGMLAAGIAHDLNNVLAPILMAPAMLRLRMTDPADLRMLDILEKSAERGSALVKQILGFANGMAGEHRPLQLKHVLRDLAAFVEQTFPKSIKLAAQFPGDLWTVLASPTQIHQVLLNLCVNARDAMPAGGTLRLNAENVTGDALRPVPSGRSRVGTWVMVEVADSGTGIPPEIVGRIWEPFFTTKGAGKGTGLGLSTVRGIVEAHGGVVELTTAVGQGSTFRVYLPATPDSAGTKHPWQSSAVPQGAGELVFVVDDEQPIRDVITRALTAHGYRVLSAANGIDAVAAVAARSEDIRLIIVDQHLPGMDGTVLASIFRRLNPKLRLLGVSGNSIDAKAFEEKRLPLDAFLPKPFTVDALRNAVHLLLSAG